MTSQIRIPVFVSRPLALTRAQAKSLEIIESYLSWLNLEPRTVDSRDLSDSPLTEVRALARTCSGGIILGFIKRAGRSVRRRGMSDMSQQHVNATPWNQIEAGMLFTLDMPLLIFREAGVTGGVFDEGSAHAIVRDMPMPGAKLNKSELEETMLKWSASVRAYYYRP